MFILYDILFLIFAICYLPYVIVKRKWHGDFATRFGFFPKALKARLSARPNIWVHAVSVGEVVAVKGLVERLGQEYPQHQLVISTVTVTGNQLARKEFPDSVIVYAPLDFSASVRSYCRAIRPVIYVAAETEIWPNIFYELSRRRIPIIQVNGRISDKSFKNYLRFRWVLKKILSYVNCFCMQTMRDADRIRQMGAPSGKVLVTGNMKFDESRGEEVSAYEPLRPLTQGEVIVAGSTHPGEEEILLDAFGRLKKARPGLRLILAPRHVERVAEVRAMAGRYPLSVLLLSDVLKRSVELPDVILVDTIGHLRHLYAYATVVFIGKSLCGKGGQNMIEPAAFKKPIIIGPHMENFRAVVDLFLSAEGVVMIQDATELYPALNELLGNPAHAARIGERAYRVVESQRGSIKKTLQAIQKFL